MVYESKIIPGILILMTIFILSILFIILTTLSLFYEKSQENKRQKESEKQKNFRNEDLDREIIRDYRYMHYGDFPRIMRFCQYFGGKLTFQPNSKRNNVGIDRPPLFNESERKRIRPLSQGPRFLGPYWDMIPIEEKSGKGGRGFGPHWPVYSDE